MIDAGVVERFQRDGAVCIRGLFSAQEIAGLRAGIDWNLGNLSPRAKVASGPDDPGCFVEDFCNWQDNPHYRRFIFESTLAQTAARLMGSSTARLYHDHMLTKETGTRQPTPWHQDQPYYNIEGRRGHGARAVPALVEVVGALSQRSTASRRRRRLRIADSVQKSANDGIQPLRASGERGMVRARQHAQFGVG